MSRPDFLLELRCLRAQATILHLASSNCFLNKYQMEAIALVAHDVDTVVKEREEAELGVGPGTTLPSSPVLSSHAGTATDSSHMSAISMKSESPELPISRDIWNLSTLVLLGESKERLRCLSSTWSGGPELLHKPLRTAVRQVDRAIANMERFETRKVNAMISPPSKPTSRPENSMNWNLWNSTSPLMPGTIDSLVCTETFVEDTPTSPRTPRKPSYGMEETLAPERPRKHSRYFAPSSPGMPYTSGLAQPDRWPGSQDSLWNTLV